MRRALFCITLTALCPLLQSCMETAGKDPAWDRIQEIHVRTMAARRGIVLPPPPAPVSAPAPVLLP